jgi:hypothetical protein
MAKITIKKEQADKCKNKIVVRHRSYLVTIKGTAPLLFNKMPDLSKTKGEKGLQIKADPVELERLNWKNKLHFRSDIGVILPGINLQNNWMSGAQYWGAKIPGTVKTYSDLFKSACVVDDMPLGITNLDDERLEQFGSHCTGNVSKGSRGGKVFKIRPLVKSWGGSCVIHVFDDRLTDDVLQTAITFAGVYRGIGDWRPRFGRYSLEKIEEVDSVEYV